MLDYRKITEASDIDPDEFMKLLHECLGDAMFRERLLNKLIIEAVGGMQSLDEKKVYMGKETLIIVFREALRYAGYGAVNTSDDGKE